MEPIRKSGAGDNSPKHDGRKKKGKAAPGATDRPTLQPTVNPLLRGEELRTVDVQDLQSPTICLRRRGGHRRELLDLRRRESAAIAVAGLKKGVEIYGFTKGQFSLLDLLSALLAFTGPARVSLSTWTAARHEIQALDALLQQGKLLGCRWLVDFTFARRDPEAAHQIRKTFGLEAIRVAQTHSKFALFTNDDWSIVLRTSMNLNMNPRFEDFTVAHDPELAAFLTRIMDEIWTKQKRTLADGPSKEFRRFFTDQM